ncbi:MAG TPA: methyltransferase domain-containing protein [Burkholderiaceae bacterium]|nr:methyltransferase domain-containing protein [Burkholderiaceae bacterium]
MQDIARFGKAFVSNQIARVAPSLYVRLTGQTGRGEGEVNVGEIAEYFRQCYADYAAQLNLDTAAFEDFLSGKTVLEYGPGDILGVALLLYAHGAAFVRCVDRFPLERISDTNAAVYRALIDSLVGEAHTRACSAFREPGKPESGFLPEKVQYTVSRDGLAREHAGYDLVISRAVLEHVNRLDQTLADVAAALRKDGVSIHCVDLRSHGLDQHKPLDFLTWSDTTYGLMYSKKGFPNRWRLDKYREWVEQSGLRFKTLVPTEMLALSQIDDIASRLAGNFRAVPREELRWLGFWMVLEHRAQTPASSPERSTV